MRRQIPGFIILLLILASSLALSACNTLNRSDARKKSELEDFMYALRWQRYQEAAAFFSTDDHRRTFLDQFDALSKDLIVTDIRLKRSQPRDNGRAIDVLLEMDYQILPSANLKTLRIEQTWVYNETADVERNGFRIATPFPKFPEETARKKSQDKGVLPP